MKDIAEIKETASAEEANELLKAGWMLLQIGERDNAYMFAPSNGPTEIQTVKTGFYYVLGLETEERLDPSEFISIEEVKERLKAVQEKQREHQAEIEAGLAEIKASNLKGWKRPHCLKSLLAKVVGELCEGREIRLVQRGNEVFATVFQGDRADEVWRGFENNLGDC